MNRLTEIFERARKASCELAILSDDKINEVLRAVSHAAVDNSDYIISQNRLDLDRMDKNDPKYDRLMLTSQRINDIAADIVSVSNLESPLGRVLSESIRPNGMKVTKVTVPFGVIGIIYEARPNVSFDVFSLCFKSGNASILKGGSDAHYSNTAIIGIIKKVLKEHDIDDNCVTLLPPDREATLEMLNATQYIDLIIPRGSSSLINFVRENSKVPVIETGAGICHVYFNSFGDVSKGADIIFNSKTRRVSVCNAMDTLIIDNSRLGDLPSLCEKLSEKSVVIYADDDSFYVLSGKYPSELLKHADESNYGTEYLDYKMSVKSVENIDEAIRHISNHSSRHSESIITDDRDMGDYFTKRVDAACVYVNVSTSFTDGSQFGFGAEIGISTQKLHARGPMALPELTSYKYIISGNGQIRIP